MNECSTASQGTVSTVVLTVKVNGKPYLLNGVMTS